MLTYVACALRRGPMVVTTFSVANFGTRNSSSVRVTAGRKIFESTFGRKRNGLCASSTTASKQSAVTTDVELKKTLGAEHPAYEVLEEDVVFEHDAYCTLYRHKKSGAELLSVAMKDDDKVFGITFRTPLDDSTGVAHILEHSVMCGSRKYKVKNPFVQIMRGSLQTFLNATTYPDRTCYVVASQNLKDFYNLIDVYTDAVFHPRATKDPMVFAQEGWRLELEDKEEPLTYNGVVYNEMKGVYSSPDDLLDRASQRSIFPDNTYGVCHGGDPKVIPSLSYQQFVDFHKKFYHPSNSRIYFSGDDDVYKRLELMDEYLQDFDELAEAREKSIIDWQSKSYSKPIYEAHPYPVGANQPETHMVNVNWLLNDKPLTRFEELTIGILHHLLLSVLHGTLAESGLGEEVTGGGIQDELLQTTFSIGLKGVQKEDVEKVEQLIVLTLEVLAEEGFISEEIASAIKETEFSLREFDTKPASFPKGLRFMLSAMSKWLYDESPTEALKFEASLAELRAKTAESGSQVFQDMIRKMILDNTHRSTIELAPSKILEEEQLKEEENRLAKIKSSLLDDKLQDIIHKTTELKNIQAAEDSPEARATIPSLELNDLREKESEYPIDVTENENDSGVKVIRHQLGSTSGMAYVRFGVDLSVLPLQDVPLLPLFAEIITGDGLHVSIVKLAVHTTGSDESKTLSGENMITKLMIHGKATSNNTDSLFSFMKLTLTDAKLDSQNIVIERLKESQSKMESDIQSSGHSATKIHLLARYCPTGFIDEMLGGITYVDALEDLIQQAEEDWPTLLARLENMRSLLLSKETCRNGMFVDVTGDAAVLEAIQPSIDKFLEELPGDSDGEKLPDFYEQVHPWIPEVKKQMEEYAPLKDEGFVVPTHVSCVGKAGLLYGEGESVSGSAQVVSRFLRTGYLWDNVRVIGGAYRVHCTFSPYSGFLSFMSYHDPNLVNTIDVYHGAADALLNAADSLENDPDAIATAIIGTIGDRDRDGAKASPDQKGYISLMRYLKNESIEQRQKVRDEIIATKPSDFRDFAERLKKMSKPSVAVVGSKAAFEAAAKEGKHMTLHDIFKNRKKEVQKGGKVDLWAKMHCTGLKEKEEKRKKTRKKREKRGKRRKKK